MNPLLTDEALPRFDAIRPEHVTPALDVLLSEAQTALDAAGGPDVPADADALARVLDLPVERLTRNWGHVVHLQAVVDTPALRSAYADNLGRVIEFFTRLSSDAGLYAKTRAIAASASFADLSPVRRKAVQDALRDFELGGAALVGQARTRFADIQARAAQLSQRFGQNVLDATDDWSVDVPESRLAGVPADVVKAARDAASAAGVDGCRLTLHAPCRLPVMSTAEDRELRRTVYAAQIQRASDLGPPARDNTALMQELVALRQEESQLLGRQNYGELSLAAKMAESPAQVLQFLRDLASRARPHAQRELKALREHAQQQFGIDDLQPWDRAFISEKLKQQLHGIDDEALRPWFTLPQVLAGLFDLVQKLFNVQVVADDAPAWHADVRYFRVERQGETIGAFYLDLFARAGKQSGAWMDGAHGRWRRPDGQLQRPLAHLVCNFTRPIGDRPSLLTHDDVITLFHEFGHGLHHLLTEVDERALSGIEGVEWDAAELPSQFMENFCWEWEVLQQISAHVDTGAKLPQALYQRMLAARHFGSGLRMLGGVELALFDMRLHVEADAGHGADLVTAIALAAAREVDLLPRPEFDRWQHAFLHIFDGGYAAGYYGYHWAEVLSSDAFAAFEEQGLFDTATGQRFRQNVLETGGSRSALENFVAFRGRPPQIDALLRHQGMS